MFPGRGSRLPVACLFDRVEAGDAEALHRLRTVNQVIAASPALETREREAVAACADSLAVLLAAESHAPAGDVDAQVAANALIGVHRALIDYIRRRVLADDRLTRLAADFREQATRAFALLERGLGDRFPAQPSGGR